MLRRVFAAGLESPTVPLTSPNILSYVGGDPTASGAPVSERTSLGVPAVWRAVNLIAGTCASLPIHVYRQVDDVRVTVGTGWAARLLRKPHPDLTVFEVLELTFASLLLWGNAYWRVVWRGMADRELWLIDPSKVRAGRASDGTKMYEVDGEPATDYQDGGSVFHVPGFGYDGICGVSPIRIARQGIGLAMSAEEYGAKLFGSGSLATGLLQTEQRLTPEQADALQARWKAKRQGMASAHETIVLDSGAQFTQLSIPPQDAQFIETRRFQISEVARMFGVPPHMLMDTEKSTSWGSGIEQQGIGFVVYTLRPWLTRVEQRLSRLVAPEASYVRFSVEGLLRGDSTQRAAFYRTMWELGVFSTNEIRALEDREPVEGGNVRYRPLNMGALGTTDSASVAAPTDGIPA